MIDSPHLRPLPMWRFVLRTALVLFLVGAAGIFVWFQRTGPSDDPDAARIVTDDVTRFWEAYDASTPETRVAALQMHYIDQGTPGLEGFLPQRIISAEALAQTIDQNALYYLSTRESTLQIAALEPAIRSAFHQLKARYPDAVFPDVYFVMGRMNSGGTTGRNALIIGAEMYGMTESFPKDSLSAWHRAVLAPPEHIPAIVAHELIHYQQPFTVGRSSLLEASIREGAADFVAELISGQHINEHVHAWADPREDTLWEAFRARMHEDDYTGWLYDGNAAEDRPADLGYWMGYKIVQAFYEQSADKTAALREILRHRDAKDFLRKSNYGGSP